MRKREERVNADPSCAMPGLRRFPRLHAYAITLCRSVDRADDLVQEILPKAWGNIDSFHVGSNMTAWLFMILLNQFRSDYRKRLREVGPDDSNKMQYLRAAPTQINHLQNWEVWQTLWQLPIDQRNALVLVALSELSCAEAAEICRCAVGTVKSRVSRAGAQLAVSLDGATFWGPDGITRAVLAPNGSIV